MVTVNNLTNRYNCLSTDDKPVTGVRNGSELREIDTGKYYVFDESIHSWALQMSRRAQTQGTVTVGTTWSGDNPYTQSVTVSGYTVTNHTKIDLLPVSEAIDQLATDGVNQLYIVNDNTVLTAYAIGATTTATMTIPALFTEVS